jgi:phosphoenolpyruvate carboxylase
MRRYRGRPAESEATAAMHTGIHISINGLAAGLRNTG